MARDATRFVISPDQSSPAVVREMLIARVGAQGDGVTEGEHGPLYVPFTLGGERVSASFEGTSDRGRLERVIAVSGERVAPVCRHFTQCGGCAVQHMAPATYAAWKRDAVVSAFSARGIEADVAALVRVDGRRRRAIFSVRRTSAGLLLGFHEAQSHDLVDVVECPVLEPRIVTAIPGLKVLIAPLMSARGEARITVTATVSGLDVGLEGIVRKLTSDVRAAIAAAAVKFDFVRVSVEGEPVYEAIAPFLVFGATDVVIPPGVFIQAVAAAERAMVDLVIGELGSSKKVVDLFSGLGAFTLPIAARSKVLAVDSDKLAIAALANSVRKATGIKPVTTLVRDLFREPMSALELNEHDAAIFDPPRAGAEAQARMLARSKLKTVVAVSCNPATLARDARTLIDGGYSLRSVTPVDQFVYSPHIEAVAVFRR